MKNIRKENLNYKLSPYHLHFNQILSNMEIAFKMWKRDGIIKLSNSKKILSLFYSLIRTYCRDFLYQEIFFKFLLKHRNVFNKEFIEEDILYRNLFRSVLFKIRNETDYKLYNLILNKDYCEY